MSSQQLSLNIFIKVYSLLCGKWLESVLFEALYEVWPHRCLIISDGSGIKMIRNGSNSCDRKQAAICCTSLFLCLSHLELEGTCGCLKQSVYDLCCDIVQCLIHRIVNVYFICHSIDC